MSGTYRGLSVNDHFRRQEVLEEKPEAVPKFRRAVLNKVSLINYSATGKTASRGNAFGQAANVPSPVNAIKSAKTAIVRQPSQSSTKMSSRDLPDLRTRGASRRNQQPS